MFNNMYGGSVKRFVGFTIFNWLGAMLFVYMGAGPSSINQWSALGALTVPGCALLYQLLHTLVCKLLKR